MSQRRERMEWPRHEPTDVLVRAYVPATGEIHEGPLKLVLQKMVHLINLGLTVRIVNASTDVGRVSDNTQETPT